MKFAENEICRITESIWKTSLNLDMQRSSDTEVNSNSGITTLAGCVHVTGGWKGAICLLCPEALAQKAAAVMFGMEPEEIELELSRDALGEIANMTGGNFKALCPPPCTMSLPTVVEGTDFRIIIPDSRVLTQVVFDCGEQKLLVKVLEKDENAKGGKSQSAK